MSSTTDSHLNTRLQLFWEMIPNASRQRTDRGRMLACRHLTEHLARARQLRAYAKTEADHKAVEGLIAEIEQRRDKLADNGQLARRIREARTKRPEGKDLEKARAMLRSLTALSERIKDVRRQVYPTKRGNHSRAHSSRGRSA